MHSELEYNNHISEPRLTVVRIQSQNPLRVYFIISKNAPFRAHFSTQTE